MRKKEKFKVLDPSKYNVPKPPPPLPSCDAEVGMETVTWRKSNGDTSVTCKNQASVRILGKNYCKKHGGLALLQLFAAGDLEIKE